MDDSAYGPFSISFRREGLPVPGYLCLLNLGHEQNSLAAIEQVHQAMASGDRRGWVERLLAGPNWRPHLVAAVACILDRDARIGREALWRRLELGSWVAPQLAVAAYLSDPEFSARLRAYLENCTRRSDGVRPATFAPGAKAVASLLAAGSLGGHLAGFVERMGAEPSIAGLLAEDAARDRSDTIVRYWAQSIGARFASRGRPLRPLDPAAGPASDEP